MSGALSRLAGRVGRQARTSLVQRRGFAADAHGEVKYNAWEKPTQIPLWKEEHIVFVVLGGWAVGITAAMKIFGGGKKATPEAPAVAAA